ncbi:DEAD/DEAH box helicase [Gracilinema caldarium]|uniref:DEAD/DEAH box helicase domain protein n=1 Tax=Gracilinema caldarium (strain ATCC 51460 / DSM 7334 / H1) TaxID=744872 RepID=F8F188_GRAC1|nr:DEAD/DEAH box helicase [Gracilinema caldarium]AEJ18732.1 DEAD/DEAH box helicase domain protein [Gracilinema caldarium DSM 7334]
MEFTELTLHPDLQRGIADAGYVTCTPVQEQVLNNAFGGHDLYVQSQTGTGKTAAYLIVIFQRLLTEPLLAGKKALIMVPTRELAVQVEDEAKRIGKYLSFKIGSFYGGVGYAHQQKLLRESVQILIGTPGRVLDLNGSGQMNLMDLAFLVLDEADRMFDMGFYPDLRKLIKVVPPVDRRQTMLFSATLNAWVKNLAWEYTKDPLEIEITPEQVTVDEIEQLLYHVPGDEKMKLLLGILKQRQPESAIIFCNTKKYAEIVAKRLRINDIPCEFIIGDLPQVKRLKIIDDVKAGKTRYLVATDVAARGLDIEGLAMVINYDLPNEAENYVHRIGRTARAGKTGIAISLASEQDVYELPAIEKYLGAKIPSQIASEELYGEDKSEGMHIRTDTYDDSGYERSGSGRGRGPAKGRAKEERRDHGRPMRQKPVRTGEGEGQALSEGRGKAKKQPSRSSVAKEKNGQHPVRQPQRHDQGQVAGTPAPREKTAAKPNLAHLTFEERLAYYKRKYRAESSEAQEGTRAPKASAGKNRKALQSKTTPKVSAQQKEGSSKKRGILSRLLSLFKGRK